jgi:hypothetical protein
VQLDLVGMRSNRPAIGRILQLGGVLSSGPGESVIATTDQQSAFDQHVELVERAMTLGIDVESHLCVCEVCIRTSALCPASLSSLQLAVDAAAGFTWRPYPSPNLALRDRRYYLVRDSLNEARECEFVANVCGFDGPAFISGDGERVEVEFVFCALEES